MSGLLHSAFRLQLYRWIGVPQNRAGEVRGRYFQVNFCGSSRGAASGRSPRLKAVVELCSSASRAAATESSAAPRLFRLNLISSIRPLLRASSGVLKVEMSDSTLTKSNSVRNGEFREVRARLLFLVLSRLNGQGPVAGGQPHDRIPIPNPNNAR